MLLVMDNVSKRYGGLHALQNVSLIIRPGELVGVMGANGAGKTTLFSLIAGNARPSGGAIEFAGERIDRLRPDQVCRRGIARTFQIVRPLRGLTVLENVMVGALFGTGGEAHAVAKAKALDILADVGLSKRADDPAGSLTLAGHKRLEIARALATAPKLLMLDEVIAGLTPTEAREAAVLIGDLRGRHNLTILMIEHVLAALMRLAERLVVLHHGIVIGEGPPEQVSRDPRVIEAYLGRKRAGHG
jgi:branched-chain amino acid transport system ATP-binding protein